MQASPKPRKQRRTGQSSSGAVSGAEEGAAASGPRKNRSQQAKTTVPPTDVFLSSTTPTTEGAGTSRKTRSQRSKSQPALPLPLAADDQSPPRPDSAGQAKKKGKRRGKRQSEQRKAGSSADDADEPPSAPIPISIIPTSPQPSAAPAFALPTTPDRLQSSDAQSHSAPSASHFPTRKARSKINGGSRTQSDFEDDFASGGPAAGTDWDMPVSQPRSIGHRAGVEALPGLTWQQEALSGSSPATTTRSRSLRARPAREIPYGGFATPPRRSARQAAVLADGSSAPVTTTTSATATSTDGAMTWQQAFLQSTSPAAHVSPRDAAAFDVSTPNASTPRPASSATTPTFLPTKPKSAPATRTSGIESGLANLSLATPPAPSTTTTTTSSAAAKKPALYAGPQFHNSPSPASLPMPKFLRALAAVASPSSAGGGAANESK